MFVSNWLENFASVISQSRRSRKSSRRGSKNVRQRVLATEALESRLLLSASNGSGSTVLTVNSALDNLTPDDGLTTLREAVIAANADSNPTTITFDTALNGTPILLTIGGSDGILASTGDLEITADVSILGNGVTNTIIDGGGATGINDRVIEVLLGGSLTLDGVTITGGESFSSGGGVAFQTGTTGMVTNSNLSGNNTSNGSGGGLSINNPTTVVVINSTFSANSGRGGGGIYNGGGNLSLINSTVSGNTTTNSANGGGIRTRYGTTQVTNSTISGNSANRNGGVDIYGGSATFDNSIIAGNTAASGLNDFVRYSGSVSGSNNVIQDGNVPNMTGTIAADPLLGPLQDNGGPTETHALLAGSPAIDAGNNALAVDADSNALTTDQRGAGFVRTFGTVDIGAFEVSPAPDAFVVDTNVDEADGDLSPGDVSLREAIIAANADPNPSTITFASALDGLQIAIYLGVGDAAEDAAAGGDLDITSEITIIGNGATNTVIDAGGLAGLEERVLHILSGGNLTLDGVTISGGAGEVKGGGVLVEDGAVATITNSSISGNASSTFGGGIHSDGTLSVTNSTISGNTSDGGAGIYNSGSLNLTNSTISGNTSVNSGGGIHTYDGTVTTVNSTITGNTAPVGGGIFAYYGTQTLNNTIIAGNLNGQDLDKVGGSFAGANNLIQDGNFIGLSAASGNISGDPLLGPLQDNGGPTLTHALGAGSPAIDAGDDALAVDADGNALITDQRGAGFHRCVVTVDIGAFEVPAPTPPDAFVVDNNVDEADGDLSPGDLSLREAIIAANADPNPSTITFASALDGLLIAIYLGVGGAAEDAAAGGDLDITSEITITGNGATNTVIDAGGVAGLEERVLHILSGGNLTLDGVTISGGAGEVIGGGVLVDGGGIATVINSAVSGNSSTVGAGIAVRRNANLLVMNSTISGNNASQSGGGIRNQGALRLTNSTLSGNTATDSFGGGLVTYYGSSDLSNATISGNTAFIGGGVSLYSGSTTVNNSVIAGNTASFTGNDTQGGSFTGSNNLIQGGAHNGLTGTVVGDPLLGPLQDNGGPTLTHALLAGSPAIDAGDNALAVDADSNALTTDQRGIGFDRIVAGTVDIGAFEAAVVVPPADTTVTVDDGVLTITDANGGDSDDSLTLSYAAGTYTLTDAGGLTIDVSSIAGSTDSGTGSVTFPDTNVTSIVFDTLAGDDSVTVTSVQASLSGGFTIDGGEGTDSAFLNAAISAGSIDITANTITLEASADLDTTGDQTFNGDVLLTADITLVAADVTFNGTVNSGVAEAPQSLVWSDSDQDAIYRANLDGSNVQILIDTTAAPTNAEGSTTSRAPEGVVVTGSFIYWVDDNQDSIYRANLDGSNPQVLIDEADIPVSSGSSGNPSVEGLTIDGAFIYWTDATRDSIYRANLDGSNPVVLVDEANIPQSGGPGNLTGNHLQYGVKVDGSFLYWTDGAQDSIYWSNLDGTNPQVLVNETAIPASSSGSSDYGAKGIEIDGSFVYWADDTQDSIYRANLDGTSPQVLIDEANIPASSVGVSGYGQDGVVVDGALIYWADSDQDSIYRANLDGTSPQVLIDVMSIPANGGQTRYKPRYITVANLGGSGGGESAFSLTVNTTGSGTTTFNGEVGGTSALDALTTNADGSTTIDTSAVNAASITLNDAVTVSQSTTLTADEIDFGGGANSVSGTVDLTLTPAAADATIGVGGGAGTFDISDTDIAALADGFASITIGDLAAGTGAVDINNSTFVDDVIVAGGSIVVTGLNAGTNDVTLTARTGDITHGGNTATDIAGGAVTLQTLGASTGLIGGTLFGTEIVLAANSLTTDSSAANSRQFLSVVGSILVDSIDAGTNSIRLVDGDFDLNGPDAVNDDSTLFLFGDDPVLDLNGFDESLDRVVGSDGSIDLSANTLTVTPTSPEGFSGTIVGSGNIVKEGLLRWLLGGDNTYTGVTFVNAGELRIDNGMALGASGLGSHTIVAAGAELYPSGTFTVNEHLTLMGELAIGGGGPAPSIIDWAGPIAISGGTVELEAAVPGDRFTISGVISGTDGFEKHGPGIVILTGANTYTGPTIVDETELRVDGSTAVGADFTVKTGATLSGSGTIAGAVAVESGGTVSPGFGLGVLGTGNVSFASGASFNTLITGAAAGTDHNQLQVTGTVNLGGSTLNIDDGDYDAVGDETYVLIDNDGTEDGVTGIFKDLPEGTMVTVGGKQFPISYVGGDGNDVVLGVAAPTDTTAPTATVQQLPLTTTSSTIALQVVTDDPAADGEISSGVESYDLYVAIDDGAFSLFASDVTATQTTFDFTPESNRRYWFQAVAKDIAGNEEALTTSAEANTQVADVEAATTSVTNVVADTATGLLTLTLSGTDAGDSGLDSFRVFVSVDGAEPVEVPLSAVDAGTPDGGGVYSATVTYQGIRDGAAHSYRFYSVGVDGAANIEAAPMAATADVEQTHTFAAPVSGLSATGIDVQNGQTQRSYIRNVDVLFNDANGLQALIDNDRIQVEQFGLQDATPDQGTGTAVSIDGATINGNSINLDFGTNGIGGVGNTGNGFYRIALDLDGDGDFDDAHFEFFRLWADANGDGSVTNADRRFREDLNGDGVVDARDRSLYRREKGKSLLASLFPELDD